MLITCSFFEAPKYEGEKYSIANSQPKPELYPVKLYLSPAWELVCGLKNKFLTEEVFTKRYIQQLNNLGVYAVKDLQKQCDKIVEGHNIIYLCWEAAGEFCHRYIMAHWFQEKFNLDPKLMLLR